MQLTNSFTIARPADEVYKAFLDVDRIAMCMPGSTLLGEPESGTYEGEVKVKVGPLSVVYTGHFVVVSTDDDARRLKMRAVGREKRGAGSAEAQIVARLSEADGQTTVQIDTDLDIRGKVAQFGRGVIGEVTDGIMQAFAANVEQMLSGTGGPNVEDLGPELVTGPRGGSRSLPREDGARPQPSVPRSDAAAGHTSAAAASGDLDAWSLIVRPMLRRHGGSVAVIGASAVAAWLGGRAGARSALRQRNPYRLY